MNRRKYPRFLALLLAFIMLFAVPVAAEDGYIRCSKCLFIYI